MKIAYNIALEQTQRLTMTPELRQAIQLLQFTSLELNQYLEEQMQENLMLDMESVDDIDKEKYEIDWKEYIKQNVSATKHLNEKMDSAMLIIKSIE